MKLTCSRCLMDLESGVPACSYCGLSAALSAPGRSHRNTGNAPSTSNADSGGRVVGMVLAAVVVVLMIYAISQGSTRAVPAGLVALVKVLWWSRRA